MASNAGSQDTEWAKPTSAELTAEKVQADPDVVDFLKVELSKEYKTYGGPTQFLMAHMPGKKERDEFSAYVWKAIPEKADVFYVNDRNLPWLTSEREMATTLPGIFHVNALGFDTGCTHPYIGEPKLGVHV